MMQGMQLVAAEEQTVSTWSGGSTTELCVYPAGTSYAGRDFSVRISSAVVELEQSDFTPLPGYQRYLMPLTAGVRLEHEGHHKAVLAPYEVDCFSGGWRTRAFGSCRDFNLMLAGGWQGELRALPAPGGQVALQPEKLVGLYALAPVKVQVTAGQENTHYRLNTQDFLYLPPGCLPGEYQLQLQLGGGAQATPCAVLAAAWPSGE